MSCAVPDRVTITVERGGHRMKRLILGLAVGAGAMYLLDPEKGAERRARLLGMYTENKDTIHDYAHTAAQTAVVVGQNVDSLIEARKPSSRARSEKPSANDDTAPN